MTERYNVVYPPSERLLFDGGKNNKFERSIIADNESPDCANVVFVNGAVETRGGSAKLNTTSVGSFACDGLYTKRDNTGAETMVAFFGGSAWQLAVTTFSTIASAQSVFTAGVRVGTTQYENHMFIGNGYVTPYKYGGAYFTRHGVPAPTTTASVASSSAGNLAGTYSWKVTYVNSQSVEGNVGPAVTFTVTSTGGQVNLASLPVAPQSYGVNARRLYRTDAGGTSYHRVVEIANNTATTYTDNIASSAVGVTAPTDNGEPPIYSTVIYHQNRLFCNDATNPNYVWYSELAEPYTFGALNFLRIGDATADLVKGFDIYENALLVYCENSEYLVYMPSTDPADWQPVQVRSAYGSKSPFGSVRVRDQILFPAMQNSKFVGFGAVAGAALAPQATLLTVAAAGSDLKSDPIEPDMFNIQPAFSGNISAIVYNNLAYISVTYGSGNTTNNRVYVYDFSISDLSRRQKGVWVPYTGWNAAQFAIYNRKLYFGSSSANGLVYEAETDTYSDDGAAINSYYWTKEYSGQKGHENLEKDFRRVKMLVEKLGDYFMSLVYRVNSDKGIGSTVQIDLDPGTNLWGTLLWGAGVWGGGVDQEEVTIPLGQSRGKRVQFKFSNQNTLSQGFKVHGLNFNYNIRGQR